MNFVLKTQNLMQTLKLKYLSAETTLVRYLIMRVKIKNIICNTLIFTVEPGEQCDCGNYESDCNDPCCYPAHISSYERSLNSSAKSCQRTERYWCLNRPEIYYGFYLPWAVILIVSITILIALYVDFQKEKRFFRHITETRIRIIN